jgi:hypothetical protein
MYSNCNSYLTLWSHYTTRYDYIWPLTMITYIILDSICTVQYVYPNSPCDCIPGPVWTCPSPKQGRPLELGTAPPTRTRWISENNQEWISIHRQGGHLNTMRGDIWGYSVFFLKPWGNGPLSVNFVYGWDITLRPRNYHFVARHFHPWMANFFPL